MATRIKNEMVDISWNGKAVAGILHGDETRWTFTSASTEFLILFAGGDVSSFTYLGVCNTYYEHRKFQLAVHEQVNDLVSARRKPKEEEYGVTRPVPVFRRYIRPQNNQSLTSYRNK